MQIIKVVSIHKPPSAAKPYASKPAAPMNPYRSSMMRPGITSGLSGTLDLPDVAPTTFRDEASLWMNTKVIIIAIILFISACSDITKGQWLVEVGDGVSDMAVTDQAGDAAQWDADMIIKTDAGQDVQSDIFDGFDSLDVWDIEQKDLFVDSAGDMADDTGDTADCEDGSGEAKDMPVDLVDIDAVGDVEAEIQDECPEAGLKTCTQEGEQVECLELESGQLVWSEPAGCDDGNVCTDDACVDEQGCAYTFNTNGCDDQDPCTQNDICDNGSCAGVPKNCSDDLGCTEDDCDGDTGDCLNILKNGFCLIDGDCVDKDFSPNGEPCKICDPDAAPKGWTLLSDTGCDDKDPCTEGDTCQTGQCIGKPMDCTDFDGACAEGVCDQGTCKAQPIKEGLGCDDSDPCTGGDVCTQGQCEGFDKDCSDEDPCTSDKCSQDTGVCTHEGPVKPECLAQGVCAAGVPIACDEENIEYFCDYMSVEGHQPLETLCDEKDNDCDGMVDEPCTILFGNGLYLSGYGVSQNSNHAVSGKLGGAFTNTESSSSQYTLKPVVNIK